MMNRVCVNTSKVPLWIAAVVGLTAAVAAPSSAVARRLYRQLTKLRNRSRSRRSGGTRLKVPGVFSERSRGADSLR